MDFQKAMVYYFKKSDGKLANSGAGGNAGGIEQVLAIFIEEI